MVTVFNKCCNLFSYFYIEPTIQKVKSTTNEITEEFKTPLTTGICHVLSQLWSSGSAWSIISMTVCPYLYFI